MSPRRGVRLELTELAIGDIAEIADYSAKQWGRKASEKYLDELEAGLRRLREQPALLTCLTDLDSSLRYYRVRQHLLICDFRPGTIVVLTVIHASRLGDCSVARWPKWLIVSTRGSTNRMTGRTAFQPAAASAAAVFNAGS
jgi:plasmid stabilization system protein ParE